MTGHDEAEIRAEVARVARMLARAGLVEAFGHVSARTDSGFAITSVAPLMHTTAEQVIVVDREAGPVSGPPTMAPLEAPMHDAVYHARPDVGGICRGHPHHTVDWGVGNADLPLRHGLGGLAGHPVRVHDDIELITTPEQAVRVAETLAGSSSLILRSNGALAVGRDPVEAATRLFFLEERARLAVHASTTPETDFGAWERRLQHSAPELARAMAWFTARFGERSE